MLPIIELTGSVRADVLPITFCFVEELILCRLLSAAVLVVVLVLPEIPPDKFECVENL